MGRSRRRAPAAPAPPEGRRALAGTNRILATELVGATVIAVLTLVGTVVLTGTLGPFLVLVFALAGAFALRVYGRRALGETQLTGEDRVLHRLVSVLLLLTVGFAFVAAVVITAAD